MVNFLYGMPLILSVGLAVLSRRNAESVERNGVHFIVEYIEYRL